MVCWSIRAEDPIDAVVDIEEALPDKLCLQAATGGNLYETEQGEWVVVGEALYKDLVMRARSSAEAQHDRVVQQLHAELTGHGKNDNEVGGAKQRVGGSHGKQVGVAAQSGGQHYPILFIIVAVGMGIFLCWVCANFVKVLPPTVAVFKLGMLLAVLLHNVPLYEWGILGDSIQTWLLVDPQLLCFVFIPMLMFGDVLALDANLVRGSLLHLPVLSPDTVKALVPVVSRWAVQQVPTIDSRLACGSECLLWSGGVGDGADGCDLDIESVGVYAAIENVDGNGEFVGRWNAHRPLFRGEDRAGRPDFALWSAYVEWVLIAHALFGQYDLTLQTCISLVTAYASFFIAEVYFGMSGVITTFTAGMMLSWRLFILYLATSASRAIMVFTLSPLINSVGEEYSWKELTLTAWSGGLRGGVSMALAVSLSRSSFLDDAQATQVFFYYGVIKMEAVRAQLRKAINRHGSTGPTFRRSLAALDGDDIPGSTETPSSELLSIQRETYLNVLASFYTRALKVEIVPGQPEIAGLLLRTVEDAKMKVLMGLGDWKIVQSLLRDHGDDKQSCMRNAMILHLFVEGSRKTIEAVTELLFPDPTEGYDEQGEEDNKKGGQLDKVFNNLKPVWYNVRSEVDVHLREAEALLDRMPARIVHLSQRYQKVGTVVQQLQAELSDVIESGLLEHTEAQSVLEHIDADVHRLHNSQELLLRKEDIIIAGEE
ncbi:hypothetical protein Pmar_PMAR028651 [Perkinsus marinus ATCC 50983]|uniref:Cation/H+ exchanger domain-containing protein n=1 Tax=Perkinsus marinus (strain ATCC 50983 / TXsc) TaxID=423536 RepID=C5K8H9_PERM5|nr:hypothetical protein Pmar_PMAR028651 [Perkinsus marinus ATCC 50983]EER19186.1 hypothetical protein Pmar_PMAR028651 [Perkinsus marinus ATCC 50983]|eukprot:XP_002787390.1 hypothetical protein Pmar_PMAR028651 [Perkinsus marinus ATCC 50983]